MNELILIGGLAARHRDRVRDFCLRSNALVYAEPLSGLREDPQIDHLRIRNERMLSRAKFDRVIRIGNVPTLRFWRDLDKAATDVAHYSGLPFAGLTRGEVRGIEALNVEDRRSRLSGQAGLPVLHANQSSGQSAGEHQRTMFSRYQTGDWYFTRDAKSGWITVSLANLIALANGAPHVIQS